MEIFGISHLSFSSHLKIKYKRYRRIKQGKNDRQIECI